MSAHPFVDPIRGVEVILHIDDTPGVEHPDCDVRADVSPELDCFYCPKCGWNGRISGMWFMDLWRVFLNPPAAYEAAMAEVYTPDGVAIWRRSRNQLLGGAIPDELVADGQVQRVIDLLRALAEGVVF